MKRCGHCKEYKNILEFSLNSKRCKACDKIYNTTYRKNNHEKISHGKNKYSHSLEGKFTILIYAAQTRAKKKNIDFELDYDWIANQYKNQNGKCLLTNIKLVINECRNTKRSRSPFTMSIDRIDSNQGYTKNNSRLICMAMNLALNEFGEETFQQICEAYLANLPVPSQK